MQTKEQAGSIHIVEDYCRHAKVGEGTSKIPGFAKRIACDHSELLPRQGGGVRDEDLDRLEAAIEHARKRGAGK